MIPYISIAVKKTEKDFTDRGDDYTPAPESWGEYVKLKETLRSHWLLPTSGALLSASIVLLSLTIMSPATSPISSIADFDGDGVPDSSDVFPSNPHEWKDTDGDGVGDYGDAFPFDPDETSDSDGDGIGDLADFMDDGNGGVRISLLRYDFEGYSSSYSRIKYCPDAFFVIKVDSDNDGDFDISYDSDIFYCMECNETFFEVSCDLHDASTHVRFSIVAYDIWDVDNNEILDYEMLDYMPQDGVKNDEQILALPCLCSWTYSGAGDTDTPDCTLSYMISTVIL